MTKILPVCVLVTLGLGLDAQSQPPAAVTRHVFVEPMGDDHEAFRFRKLLSDGLARNGFSIARERGEADVVLATTLSTPVVGGETRAYASADVRRHDGTVLWRAEFPDNDGWRQSRGRDAVTKLAEEIVAALQRRSS